MELHEELSRRQNEIDRHRENRARLAQAYARYVTTGQGSIEISKRVDFGLTFIEEPYVSYGSMMDLNEWADTLNLDPGEEPPLPNASGFVTEWDRDANDFYIGAWVAVRVSFPSVTYFEDGTEIGQVGDLIVEPEVPADAKPVIRHFFTFAAIAIKAVPTDGVLE